MSWTAGSQGILVPAPAATAGFNTLTFSDEFTSLSTIDMALAKTAGFKWYLSNAWPNAKTPSAGWTGIDTATDTDPASLSISNSVLTKSTGIANVNQGLHTAVANGSTWRGTAFQGGALIEQRVKFDPALSATGSWPIAWMTDLRFLTGAISRHTELDLFEYRGATTMSIHDWDMSTNPATDNGNSGNWAVSPGFADANFHTLWTLWLTEAQNGGTGTIQRYMDGVLLSANTVTWTGTGQYSTLDAGTHMLILDTGAGQPTSWDYIRVWQASSAGLVSQ